MKKRSEPLLLLIVLLTMCPVLLAQDFTLENRINKFLQEIPELSKADKVEARRRANEILIISKINNGYKLGQLYFWLGELMLLDRKYDSAGICYEASIPYLESENDEPVLGRAYIGAGYILNFKAKYSQALAYDMKAEKIFRKLGDRKMLARSLKRIGDDIFYQDDSRSNEARPYFEESVAISEQEKDTLNIIRGLNVLTAVYNESKEYARVDKAMNRAIALAEKINCVRCMAISYSQWGISYHKQGNYEKAIRKYKIEFELNRKLGAEYEQFFVYQNISEALTGLKRFDEALLYSDSALRIVETDIAWNHYQDVYRARYMAYKGKGDFSKALIAFEKQMQFKDSIFSEEKERAMEDMKASYDLERKEQQIENLEQQNVIKDLEATTARQWQYGLIIILGLLSIVAGVLYNRYQLKQRTAHSLDEKNIELQKLNGFKDRMFAVISHDLRNPVDAFSTIIESLNQNLQHASREELKEFLESTLESAKDLKSLLNNLLEWSLVQIGKLPFNPKRVSLGEIVQESIHHTDSMAVISNITIKNNVDGKYAFADKSMVTIIVRNLLSNAIKFSAPGKSIELNADIQNGIVVLSVKDEGIGMKAVDVEKLFKQDGNVRSIGSSSSKGAGIGLLLCKDLTDKNNGKIYANSEEGKGSIFYLELPLA